MAFVFKAQRESNKLDTETAKHNHIGPGYYQ